MARKRVTQSVKFCIFILFIVISLYLIKYSNYSQHFSYSSMRNLFEGLGWWGVVAILGAYTIGMMLFIPATVFIVISVMLYGFVVGTIINYIGAMLGSIAAFLFARYLGSDFTQSILPENMKMFEHYVEKNGRETILFTRLFVLFPFEIINYVAGLTRIRFHDYVIGTALGLIPGTILFSYFSAQIGEAILTGFGPNSLLNPEIIISAILMVVMTVLSIYYGRRMHKRHKEAGASDGAETHIAK